MALVDYEAVVLDLEDYVTSRKSHGQRHLLQKLAELRREHRIQESPAERVLRTIRDLDNQPTNGDSERVAVHG